MESQSDTAAKLLLGVVEIARDEREIVQNAKAALGVTVGRRIDARISFSSIEAVTYALKQLALAYETESTKRDLKPEEVLALSDLQVEVDKQGKVSTKPGKFGLYGGIRIALRIVASKRGFSPIEIDFGSLGGQAFTRSIKLRNRLTHPKSISDFEITDVEIEDVTAALKWYGEHVLYALNGQKGAVSIKNAYGS